ncbi:MAG: UDP-N-acetylmuramoyl-tripeptide--D-alanyl-D-alanine ligase [Lachnospiraceae bacterium]|nr:UDP-N-acetylmuramoyl-tripeptide--D-alanyl-D-alanine ligase [Lachnospiraceae bacterium]
MTVRTLIALLLSGYALFLAMRHNMHMFQLNEYTYDKHFNWIKKNLRQQWLLYLLSVLGILRLFFPVLGLDIGIYLVLWLIILVYRAIRRLNTKKKLVYTARVKRMIFTIGFIAALASVLTFLFAGIEPLAGVFSILVGTQWFMVMVASIINRPLELCINRHYINDAKRILKSMPDLKVIGVTGSYGKTSMKYYLQTLLQDRFSVLVTPGNFNTPLGVTRTVRSYLKPTHEIFICEMGAERVKEIKAVCDIAHPHMGVITSVGPQHLETFKSMENIQKTKFELADALPEGGMIFLNGDNEYIKDYADKHPDRYKNKTFYYSEGSGEGYRATDIKVSRTGTEFKAITPTGEEETFTMKLIGAHNVINVVGAIAVANSLGIALKDLKGLVRKLRPVEHRLQMKEQGNVTIIDDSYNSNPVGSKAAVETLALFDGLRILITPGMIELGAKETEYNYKFGTYAAKCCDYVLLVGKKRTEPIREGVLSEGFPEDRCIAFDRIEEAMSFACSIKGSEHKYILLENDLPDNY